MNASRTLRIDPVVLQCDGSGLDIEIVIPYTERSLAQAVLGRTTALTVGLNPTVRLVAVHSMPYPMAFGFPTVQHAHLVEQLIDVASECPFTVEPQVVLARSQEEGFRHVIKHDAIVLIGSRKKMWRTREEALGHVLAREGYNVALLHVE